MKELTIEEKAKRYNDILGKAKKFYDANTNEGYRGIFEEIFPEFIESNDEKIRKELIEKVKETPACIGFNDKNAVLAWLEKQGEPTGINPSEFDLRLNKLLKQFETLSKEELTSSLSFYLNVIQNDGTYREEKQGEQKPADKVEPKFKVKYAGSEYNVFETKDIAGVTFYGIEDEPNHIDYVKADNCEIISCGYGIKENGSPYPTKPAVFSEQNHAWSEEDESILQGIWDEILANKHNSKEYEWKAYDKFLDWLKSIKDRVQLQPKQEWSEEDRDYYDAIITKLEVTQDDALLTDNQMEFLKSLKERYTWKPSDEQLKALHDLNLTGNISYAGQGQVLIELYNDLEELIK